MTIPSYVPPSQWVADRASFVSDSIRDGGDGVIVARCAEGIALVARQSGADLPRGMRSISEIHDGTQLGEYVFPHYRQGLYLP